MQTIGDRQRGPDQRHPARMRGLRLHLLEPAGQRHALRNDTGGAGLKNIRYTTDGSKSDGLQPGLERGHPGRLHDDDQVPAPRTTPATSRHRSTRRRSRSTPPTRSARSSATGSCLPELLQPRRPNPGSTLSGNDTARLRAEEHPRDTTSTAPTRPGRALVYSRPDQRRRDHHDQVARRGQNRRQRSSRPRSTRRPSRSTRRRRADHLFPAAAAACPAGTRRRAGHPELGPGKRHPGEPGR